MMIIFPNGRVGAGVSVLAWMPVAGQWRPWQRAKELLAPVDILIVRNSGHNWRKIDKDIEPSRDEIIHATVEFFVSHLRASK